MYLRDGNAINSISHDFDSHNCLNTAIPGVRHRVEQARTGAKRNNQACDYLEAAG